MREVDQPGSSLVWLQQMSGAVAGLLRPGTVAVGLLSAARPELMSPTMQGEVLMEQEDGQRRARRLVGIDLGMRYPLVGVCGEHARRAGHLAWLSRAPRGRAVCHFLAVV